MNEFMAILITGASGFVGGEIAAQLSARKDNVYSGYLRNMPDFGTPICFDITDSKAIDRAMQQVKPDLIIHCAYDKNPVSRDSVIVSGTENIIDSALKYVPGVRFIFMSSEWVFDGLAGPYSEGDEPNPQTGYGKAKLAAEKIVSDKIENYAIIRTGLVSREEPPAPRWIVEEEKILAGQTVTFYSNEIRNPIHVADLAKAAIMLADSGERGIWHIAGPEYMSRYEELELYVKYRGLDQNLIVSSISDGANRPLDCSIKIDKFLKRFNLKIRSPREYLR